MERNLIEKIKNIFIKNDLSVKESKKIHITKEEASEFYKVHQSKPFYNDLCEYLSSGPIVVMVLEGKNAVLANRNSWDLQILRRQRKIQSENYMEFQ